jgi:hypothetical protein
VVLLELLLQLDNGLIDGSVHITVIAFTLHGIPFALQDDLTNLAMLVDLENNVRIHDGLGEFESIEAISDVLLQGFCNIEVATIYLDLHNFLLRNSFGLLSFFL